MGIAAVMSIAAVIGVAAMIGVVAVWVASKRWRNRHRKRNNGDVWGRRRRCRSEWVEWTRFIDVTVAVRRDVGVGIFPRSRR
ncbi:hypothetical protein ACLB2K_055158 [Fragaria x ananassa]